MRDAVRTALTDPRSAGFRPSRLVWVIGGLIITLGAAYTVSRWAIHLPDIGIWGSVEAYQGRDFRSFSTAGSLARLGDVDQLYDPTSPPYVNAVAATFVYPPWFAVGMIPASMLSFQAGYWVWMALSLGLAAWGMWAVGGRLGAITLAGLVLAAPGLQTFIFGQTAFFLVALAAAMLVAIRSNRLALAGVWGALMAFKPHIIIGVAIAWLYERRTYRWSIGSAVAVTAALFVVAELVLPGATRAWPDAVRDLSGEYFESIAEITIASVIDHLVGVEALATVTRFVVFGLGFAAFAWFLARRDLDVETTLFGAFATAVVVGFHAMTYDVLILAPLLVAVAIRRPQQRGAIAFYGAITVSLLTIGPLLTEMQLEVIGRAVALGPLALGAFVVWILATTASHHEQ